MVFQSTGPAQAGFNEAVTPSALCFYQEGLSGTLIIGSTLLLKDIIIDDGGLAILASGKIGPVGRFSDITAALPDAAVLDCRNNTILSPGWVNLHEHEAFSYAFPDPGLKPIYHHREEWIFGRNDMPVLPIPASKMQNPADKKSLALLAWVELRHLIAGTTTLGGPGAIPGLAKNVNRHASPADATRYNFEADLDIFPFSQNAIRTFTDYCNAGAGPRPKLRHEIKNNLAFAPHIGEGRKNDCTARSEVEAFLSYVAQQKNSGRRFSAVHAIAAGPEDLADFAELDVSLIWSPRSNLALYGETVDLQAARKQNVRLALGTDWSSSGSFNMLEEFTCAQVVSRTQSVTLSDHQLWLMATHYAAYAAGIEETVGQLKEGLAADLVLLRKVGVKDAYAAAVNANVEDVQVVWVDGTPIISSASVAQSLSLYANCVALPAGGKVACVDFKMLGLPWKEMLALTQKAVPISGNTRGQAACNTRIRND